MRPIDEVFELLDREGGARYGGERVSQKEHALQCAVLARAGGGPDTLVVAALFHDIGHLIHHLGEDAVTRGVDDWHEDRGASYLGNWFGPAVAEPVRLHVPAKRYLCATEADYAAGLSPTSIRTLALQGGPLEAEAASRFAALRYSAEAVRLRRWDDRAKTAGLATPSLADFRPLVEACIGR